MRIRNTFNVELHLFIKDGRAFVLHHSQDSPGWKLPPPCSSEELSAAKMLGFQLCRNVGLLQLSYSQRKGQKGRLSCSFLSAIPEKPGCCPLQGRGHGELGDILPSGLLTDTPNTHGIVRKGGLIPCPLKTVLLYVWCFCVWSWYMFIVYNDIYINMPHKYIFYISKVSYSGLLFQVPNTNFSCVTFKIFVISKPCQCLGYVIYVSTASHTYMWICVNIYCYFWLFSLSKNFMSSI